MTSTFDVLGPLQVHSPAGPAVLRGPKVRIVLALLLRRPGQVVGTDAFKEELWAERQPPSATTTLRTHIYHLRQMLGGAGALLVTCPDGYQLRIDPEQVDAGRFLALVERGREQLDRGADVEARASLVRALALWRGAPLADVRTGRALSAYVAHLTEVRLQALELRVEADLRLGRHRELIPELRALVADDPLNEWLQGQLIEALRLAGRRAEALRAYEQLRILLADELGVPPAVELQELSFALRSGVAAAS